MPIYAYGAATRLDFGEWKLRRSVMAWLNPTRRDGKLRRYTPMKIMFGLIATIALSMGAFAMPVVLQEEDAAEAVPEAVQEAVQEAAPPAPEEPAPPVEPPQAPAEPAPAEAPEAAEPVEVAEPVQEAAAEPIPMEAMSVVDAPSVIAGEIVMAQPVMSNCCSVCCCTSCCCPPPPPTPTVMCLVDPCGCSHRVCINVPACCAGEQPVICWRRGFLKRQIATLSWNCCGHQVEVVVTCFGRVIVRG